MNRKAKKDLFKKKTLPNMEAICEKCHGKMELVSGSIIIGNKWYHKTCIE